MTDILFEEEKARRFLQSFADEEYYYLWNLDDDVEVRARVRNYLDPLDVIVLLVFEGVFNKAPVSLKGLRRIFIEGVRHELDEEVNTSFFNPGSHLEYKLWLRSSMIAYFMTRLDVGSGDKFFRRLRENLSDEAMGAVIWVFGESVQLEGFRLVAEWDEYGL